MGGGVGMTPWCIVLVCSWQRLLGDRHSLPFPWTLSLHRRWCPSASHHPVTFLLALSFPLYFPFLSLGLSLHRPWCPSASHHSFPFLSLGRLCQQSPRSCPVSLLCIESTQRKATAFAVGQVRGMGWGGGGGGGCHIRVRPENLNQKRSMSQGQGIWHRASAVCGAHGAGHRAQDRRVKREVAWRLKGSCRGPCTPAACPSTPATPRQRRAGRRACGPSIV